MACGIEPPLCIGYRQQKIPMRSRWFIYSPIISPTEALVIVLGSNLKPDCEACQYQHHDRVLEEGKLTAPTAIVCVEMAVKELEAVEASMAVAVAGVVLLEPDVVLVVEVCASVPVARALMPMNNDDRSMLYASHRIQVSTWRENETNKSKRESPSSHFMEGTRGIGALGRRERRTG